MSDELPSSPRRSSLVRRSGYVVGGILLGAAAVYFVANPSELGSFIDQILRAPVWAIMLVLLGPILNWIFVSQCLWALNRRHGEIARLEMLALVGSAWLLNHLPMRPGLVGRIGYHAKVNQIRVRDSVEASVWSLVHAIIANAIGLGLALLISPGVGIAQIALILSIPIFVLIIAAMLAETKSDQLGLMIRGLMWRYADLLVWMLRYAAAFAMLGVEITPLQIVLVTAVSQAAQVIPITGGGIGFREWGVGLAATMYKGTAVIDMRTAIGADLINRVAETIIVVPLGLWCTAIVTRRFRAAMKERSSPEDESVRHPEQKDDAGHPREQHPADD